MKSVNQNRFVPRSHLLALVGVKKERPFNSGLNHNERVCAAVIAAKLFLRHNICDDLFRLLRQRKLETHFSPTSLCILDDKAVVRSFGSGYSRQMLMFGRDQIAAGCIRDLHALGLDQLVAYPPGKDSYSDVANIYFMGPDHCGHFSFGRFKQYAASSIWQAIDDQGTEQEFVGGYPTHWYRNPKEVDVHGWSLESTSDASHWRWRNIYSQEVYYDEDPRDLKLSVRIIEGMCKKMLIDQQIAPTLEQIPNIWKVMTFLFSQKASSLNLRGLELVSTFKQLLRKSPTPIPIFFNYLTPAVLNAEVEASLPGLEFADRAAMVKTLDAHFKQAFGEPIANSMPLLENLSSQALQVMAEEYNLAVDPDGSRYDLVVLVTNRMLQDIG